MFLLRHGLDRIFKRNLNRNKKVYTFTLIKYLHSKAFRGHLFIPSTSIWSMNHSKYLFKQV